MARGFFHYRPVDGVLPDANFEIADVRRYARLRMRQFVSVARTADRPSFHTIVRDHLGVAPTDLPVVVEHWPAYEHVNVQGALDTALAKEGRSHVLHGIANWRHRGGVDFADLVGEDIDYGLRPGNVARIGLPSGPDGATRECLRAAVVLVADGTERLALLVMGSDPDEGGAMTVQALAPHQAVARAFLDELRTLAVERNVYRGQVVSFGHDVFGERGSLLRFSTRQPMSAEQLILPEETFADLRRQVVGVARNSDRLRSAGQHLKRGLLLYGPPGVGKTHSVRYLIGELTGTTIVELTGESLRALREACSIARTLQPSMIVVEDVDLIAQDREYYDGDSSALFTLLNEMDGLADDADVIFLLTTNRPDLLEGALASRPGRVDQAVHIPLPDRDARRRLIDLYRGGLDLDLARLDGVLDRTEGVTASFLKELLRRAAVIAADREEAPSDGVRLRVSADDLDAALADLLDTRNRMTRAALGLRDAEALDEDE